MEMTAIAAWLNSACGPFDESIAIAVHKLYEAAPGFFTPLMNFVSLLGKGGIFLILLSLCLTLYRPTRRYGTAMLLGIAVGALITNILVKPLVARPRPYTWDGSVFQQFWRDLGKHTESDKSFPSGHMTAAMAVSTALFLRGNRKISWTAFIFAFLMGVSRIYLSVHYATDVLGGLITGAIGGTAGYFISLRLPERYYLGDARNLLPGYKQKGRHMATSGEDREEPAEEPIEEPVVETEEAEERRTVVIDGENFADLRGFLDEMDRVLGSETPTRNLDALNDLLRGGLGENDPAVPLEIRWLHADKSRRELGYEATAAYYERALSRVHPKNKERAEALLAAAKREEGPTLFDKICALLRRTDTGHDCTLTLE